jgi:hypothetical protein
LSGGLFGTIGYFLGLSTGQSRIQIAQNQPYSIYKPSLTIMHSAAITTSLPTLAQNPSPTEVVLPKLTPIPGWKVYTSSTEKISFRYPDNWLVVKSPQWATPYLDSDNISIRSPDGQVTINWVSFMSGLGGGCDTTNLAKVVARFLL